MWPPPGSGGRVRASCQPSPTARSAVNPSREAKPTRSAPVQAASRAAPGAWSGWVWVTRIERIRPAAGGGHGVEVPGVVGTGVDDRQLFPPHQVGVGPRPGHHPGVARPDPDHVVEEIGPPAAPVRAPLAVRGIRPVPEGEVTSRPSTSAHCSGRRRRGLPVGQGLLVARVAGTEDQDPPVLDQHDGEHGHDVGDRRRPRQGRGHRPVGEPGSGGSSAWEAASRSPRPRTAAGRRPDGPTGWRWSPRRRGGPPGRRGRR